MATASSKFTSAEDAELRTRCLELALEEYRNTHISKQDSDRIVSVAQSYYNFIVAATAENSTKK